MLSVTVVTSSLKPANSCKVGEFVNMYRISAPEYYYKIACVCIDTYRIIDILLVYCVHACLHVHVCVSVYALVCIHSCVHMCM